MQARLGLILTLLAGGSVACGAHFETIDESPLERHQGALGQAVTLYRGASVAGASYDAVTDTTIQLRVANQGMSEYCSAKGGSNPRACLLRWDTSRVPTSAKVQGALLRITVADPSKRKFRLFALKRDWVESEADFSEASAGVAWGLPGAHDLTDSSATPLGRFKPSTTGSLDITLNPAALAIIQGWVTDPTSNHGLIIYNSVGYDGVSIRSSEWNTPGERPTPVLQLAD